MPTIDPIIPDGVWSKVIGNFPWIAESGNQIKCRGQYIGWIIEVINRIIGESDRGFESWVIIM